jgi:hypothetical protein
MMCDFIIAAERKAGHRGDHRLPHLAHLFPIAGDVVAEVGVHVAVRGHRADVGAGRKCFFVAGDDDAANAGIGIGSAHRLAELVHQRIVERVELLGPVQCDQHHGERAVGAVVSGSEDVLSVHRSSISRCGQGGDQQQTIRAGRRRLQYGMSSRHPRERHAPRSRTLWPTNIRNHR